MSHKDRDVGHMNQASLKITWILLDEMRLATAN